MVSIEDIMPVDWKIQLDFSANHLDFESINAFLFEKMIKKEEIFPPLNQVFSALNHSSFENTKVVILGQDPYHGTGEAHGLSFSVREGIKIPPSLKNIFKELNTDIEGFEIPVSGDLTSWASQGVLLLNSILTVTKDKAGSHRNSGWSKFTDRIIRLISDEKVNVVFILWGSFAIEKKSLIDQSKHMIIESPHPSPLSSYRGFFDSQPFSKTNAYLKKNNLQEINWILDNTQTKFKF
jgi:uracil-DNA glycosylase